MRHHTSDANVRLNRGKMGCCGSAEPFPKQQMATVLLAGFPGDCQDTCRFLSLAV